MCGPLAPVSDGGLQLFAMLFRLIEHLGSLLDQMMAVCVTLLAKPKGGYRGIGIMPSLHRVWNRCHRDICRTWEQEHTRGYIAFAAASSHVDAVWRQAFAVQEARKQERPVVGSL